MIDVQHFFLLNIKVSFVKKREYNEKSTFDTHKHTGNKNYDYLNYEGNFPGIEPRKLFSLFKHIRLVASVFKGTFWIFKIRTFLFCMHVRECKCMALRVYVSVLIQIHWIYLIEKRKEMLTFYKLNIPLDRCMSMSIHVEMNWSVE